jgi:hypothetical protein
MILWKPFDVTKICSSLLSYRIDVGGKLIWMERESSLASDSDLVLLALGRQRNQQWMYGDSWFVLKSDISSSPVMDDTSSCRSTAAI